jgi:hypothetical protein
VTGSNRSLRADSETRQVPRSNAIDSASPISSAYFPWASVVARARRASLDFFVSTAASISTPARPTPSRAPRTTPVTARMRASPGAVAGAATGASTCPRARPLADSRSSVAALSISGAGVGRSWTASGFAEGWSGCGAAGPLPSVATRTAVATSTSARRASRTERAAMPERRVLAESIESCTEPISTRGSRGAQQRGDSRSAAASAVSSWWSPRVARRMTPWPPRPSRCPPPRCCSTAPSSGRSPERRTPGTEPFPAALRQAPGDRPAVCRQ